MKLLNELMRDRKGKLSSARFVMTVILLWHLLDWLVIMINTGSYDLTTNKLILLISALGLKGVQKFGE